MIYLKEYNQFNQYVELECGLLDVMTGEVRRGSDFVFRINGNLDDYQFSESDKNIISKYYLSIEELIKDDINFNLIETAKDLSLEYLDEGCILEIYLYLKDTTPSQRGFDPEYRVYSLEYTHDYCDEKYPILFKEKYDKVKEAKRRNKFTINGRSNYSYVIYLYNGTIRKREYESNIIESLKEEFPDYKIDDTISFKFDFL